MRLQLRVILFSVAALLGLTTSSRADFTWFNSSSNLMYYANALTPLYGVKGNSAVSCFLQLIYAGADNSPDVANAAHAYGTDGDDVVVDWSYIGSGMPGSPGSTSHYGRVAAPAYADHVDGGYYYVRAWTEQSPDFVNGFVPGSLTNFYGNSAVFQAPAGFEPPAFPQDIDFGGPSGIIANLTAVPEPRALLLALLGLCTVRRWIRRAN